MLEIYHRKAPLLGVVFLIPLVLVILVQWDIIEYSNKAPNMVGYIIIVVLALVVLLTLFGSTRLYFDNNEQACIQLRAQFYGTKRIVYPYSEIVNIVVALNFDSHNSMHIYKVGFTQEAKLLGMPAKQFHELRAFGKDHNNYVDAVLYARNLSKYTGIAFLDDTQKKI